MKNVLHKRITVLSMLCLVQIPLAMAQEGIPSNLEAPAVPSNLTVPTGHSAWLKTHAIGTQNYVCLPGPNGPAWRFLGPQATLFVPLPWSQNEATFQVATHFLSANPEEAETPRPAWQSSHDTSAVWGKAIGDSTDPAFVAAGAIPWLLVEKVGSKSESGRGSGFSQTTYIHRVNTIGGVAPTTGCDDSNYGRVALVPYTTDYYFYRLSRQR